MTSGSSSTDSGRDFSPRMLAAISIFGVIVLLFFAHMMLFSLTVGANGLESVFQTGAGSDSLYASGLRVWQVVFGESSLAARSLSMLAAVLGLGAMALLCSRWADDVVVGAIMPLGFVLFPQTAYAFALAIPYSLLMTLVMLGLFWATVSRDQSDVSIACKLGAVCGLLPFLHPIGFGLSLVVAIAAFMKRQGRLFFSVYAGLTIATVLALWLIAPMSVPALPVEGSKESLTTVLQSGVLRPFSMLWLALAFSACALWRSEALRKCIGGPAVRRSIVLGAAFFVLVAILVTVPPWEAEDPRVFLNAVIGLGLLATWPLVLWIRFVMPNIQSVWIWILLPVVMYSCFWVVMGPINLAGFPYDQISSPS